MLKTRNDIAFFPDVPVSLVGTEGVLVKIHEGEGKSLIFSNLYRFF